jgi:hypothetical protein
MFDPNSMPDFAAQSAAIAQQRKMADYLRKQAAEAKAPEGQMISGHYVAPSIFEYGGGMMDKFFAGNAERDASAGEVGLAQSKKAFNDQWMSEMPTGTPAVEAQEAIPTPMLDARVATPAQEAVPSTNQENIKWMAKGMANPDNVAMATLLGGGLNKSRDQYETIKAAESLKKWTIQQQLADKAEARGEKIEAAAIRAAADKARDDKDRESRADNLRLMASLKPEPAPKAEKPLPTTVEKEYRGLASESSTLGNLKSSFKDDYAGGGGAVLQRAVGGVLGGMAPKNTEDMTRWWADQAMYDELPKRHALFGSALTPTEKSSWANAAISPNMSPEKIRERLATREKITTDAMKRITDSYSGAGYSKNQIEVLGGMALPGGSPATVGSNSYETAKSGETYTAPDGSTRRKK